MNQEHSGSNDPKSEVQGGEGSDSKALDAFCQLLADTTARHCDADVSTAATASAGGEPARP